MTFYVKNVSGSIGSIGLADNVPNNGIVDLEEIQGDGTPLHPRVNILGNDLLWTVVADGTWQLLEDDGTTPLSTSDAKLKLNPATLLALAQLEAVTTSSPAPVHGTTSNPTRSAQAWADIPEMTIAVIPLTTKLDIDFSGAFELAPSVSGATVEGKLQVVVDGQAVDDSERTLKYTSPAILALTPGVCVQHPRCVVRAVDLTPGVQCTVAVQWQAVSETLKALGTQRTLRVRHAQ